MKPIGEDAQLLLGVDGGGTKTVACLARRSNDGQIVVLGKGKSGPGNPARTECRTRLPKHR